MRKLERADVVRRQPRATGQGILGRELAVQHNNEIYIFRKTGVFRVPSVMRSARLPDQARAGDQVTGTKRLNVFA